MKRRLIKQNRLEDIRGRMANAELSPWKKVRGSYGWQIIQPKDAWGRNDVLIASGLDGDTAIFLANVPDDMRWMLSEIENLKWQLSQKAKKK